MTEQQIVLTEAQLKLIIRESVDETLLRYGFDSQDPLEMQADLRHLREWRVAVNSMKAKSIMAVLGILVSGALAAMWVGLKILVGKG